MLGLLAHLLAGRGSCWPRRALRAQFSPQQFGGAGRFAVKKVKKRWGMGQDYEDDEEDWDDRRHTGRRIDFGAEAMPW